MLCSFILSVVSLQVILSRLFQGINFVVCSNFATNCFTSFSNKPLRYEQSCRQFWKKKTLYVIQSISIMYVVKIFSKKNCMFFFYVFFNMFYCIDLDTVNHILARYEFPVPSASAIQKNVQKSTRGLIKPNKKSVSKFYRYIFCVNGFSPILINIITLCELFHYKKTPNSHFDTNFQIKAQDYAKKILSSLQIH